MVRIAVLGAGGHTGRFVVDALRRLGATAIPATRTGRFQPIDGAEEACRVIDFADVGSLDRAMMGADAIINCAGPFFDTAVPAAEAALRARIPYFDVAAEQRTVQDLFDRLDGPARDAGVTLVPAMAFYGGLADLLASALVPSGTRAQAIDIAVGLDSWHPTAGTRLTGERNTFERLVVRDGRLVPVPSPPPAEQWQFPAPFGEQPVTCVALSEMVLLSRHIDAAEITSFMNLAPLADLHDAATPAPRAADDRGRSAQHFVMDVRATIDGRVGRAVASGRDIYAVTAPLVVKACLTVLGGNAVPTGVRAPGEIFDPAEFLANLAPDIMVDLEGATDAGGLPVMTVGVPAD
jgi:hypothetical protein